MDELLEVMWLELAEVVLETEVDEETHSDQVPVAEEEEEEADEVFLADVALLEAVLKTELEVAHSDQVGSTEEEEEVFTAGVLVVVLEEVHDSQPSAETRPAMAPTVAIENFILIELEVLN